MAVPADIECRPPVLRLASLQPRTARRRLAWIAAIGAIGAVGLPAVPAAAAGSKEAQGLKALKQALDEDYLQTRFDAAEQKLRAAVQACGKACSVGLRARLHAALGSVLAGGKKELEDARDEFVEALGLDPRIEPNPDILSTEVSFAYEQARKTLHLAAGASTPSKSGRKPARAAKPEPEPDDKPEPTDRPDRPDPADKPEPEPDGPPAPPARVEEPARKNWVTVTFSPDLALVSGTDVCTASSQNDDHYVCLRPDGSRYVGTPTVGNGDSINSGLALATLRVMLGYDRVVHPNLTLGLRAGFAFNGASGGGASFLPVHGEARLGIWPGHDPFVGTGVRPFFVVSGGLAQVDSKVSVQVLEDGQACHALNPASTSSACTTPSSDGITEPRQQTLTVFKQNGLGFSSLSFGVQFAPSAKVALHLAARATVTFPVVTAVISPEGGLSVGF